MKLFTKKKNILLLLALILTLNICSPTEFVGQESELNELENLMYIMKSEKLGNDTVYDDQNKYKVSEGDAHITEEPVNRPDNFEELVKGYAFVISKEEEKFVKPDKPDRFELFHGSFVIYKDKEGDSISNQVLDIKLFGNKCGLPQLCLIGEKDIPDYLRGEPLKGIVDSVLGIFKSPAKCQGDSYKMSETMNGVVLLCFDNDKDFEAFNKLLKDKINPADFTKKTDKAGENKADEDKNTFELAFSDGHEGFEMYKTKSSEKGLEKEGSPNEHLIFYKGIEDIAGKKCAVLHNLPIIPINFLDNDIVNPLCILKLKHDNMDIYIGSKKADCHSIIPELKKIMIDKCMEINNLKQPEEVNKPAEGIWTGNVLYVKKTKGKPDEDILEEAILKISPKSVDIIVKEKVETLNFKVLKWPCNNDGSCHVNEFFNAYDKTKLETEYGKKKDLKKKIMEKWNSRLPDTRSCIVIELFEEIKVLCPEKISEEYNMKRALSISTDLNLLDKPIKAYSASPNETFKIIISKEADKLFKEYTIKVKPEGVLDDQGALLIDYSKIQPVENVVCAMEFRSISLPIHFADVNPICCAKIHTEETNYFCVQHQSKCYIQLRQMILKIRQNCLDSKGLKLATDSAQKGDAGSQNKFDIIFAKINNYKHHGESKPVKGTINLDKVFVSFKDDKGKDMHKFNYETLDFFCEKSEKPCSIKDFIQQQDPFMNADSDKIWLQSAIRNFFSSNSNIKEQECMIVVSVLPKTSTSKIILACSSKPDQGEFLRNSIARFYQERIKSFANEAPELDTTPSAFKNQEYTVKLFTNEIHSKEQNLEPSKIMIKVAADGILMKTSQDYLIKFENIIDFKNNKINLKYKVEKSEIDADKHKINEACCFSAQTNTNSYHICSDSEARCYYDKVMLYRLLNKKAKNKLKFETARKIRIEKGLTKADDPFEFGLTPNYKDFGSDFKKLRADTLDISKNGIWHGWIFFASLTDRNYNLKVSPVWMEIENGKIKLKTDYVNKFPYKTLYLKHYDQICDGHCQPHQYIDNKLRSIEDYEDTTMLKKTINNITSQLVKPFDGESCTVLDFVDPLWGYGHSYIICGIDEKQGHQIRETINISYYEALLNLDIDTEVRKPYLDTEHFHVVFILGGEIQKDLNHIYVEKDGFNVIAFDEETKEVNKEVPLQKILFKDISSDNFGVECAMWYKNLDIKKRGEEFYSVISDNNCCFRFFSGPEKKKTEICTTLKEGGICIKQSRQLMKGIRSHCREYIKNLGKQPTENDEVEAMVDIYSEKTVNDSENGNFEGFAYIGSAIKPSQILRQVPCFIKIQKQEIKIFADLNTKKPDITIKTDNIVFSCKDSTPCKPSSFKTHLLTTTKDPILGDSIKTTYGLFKDTYGYNDDTFEKNCFILEDRNNPFLICTNNVEMFPIIKKSIVQAYNLNYSCKQITSKADIDPTMEFKVKIFKKDTPTSDNVKVTGKGVLLSSKKEVLFEPKDMDKDPVTGANCAVWFKELPNKVNFEYPQCCFAVSVKSVIYTICTDIGEMCIGDSFKLLKSIWNSCMGQDGSNPVLASDPDPEILGQAKRFTPKVPFTPASARFYSCPAKRKTRIIDEEKQVEKEIHLDGYNDIAYSKKKSLYKGWFKVYPVQNTAGDKDYMKLYGEFSKDSFLFFASETDKTTPKLQIRPELLSMACGISETCKPLDFLTKSIEYGITLPVEKFRNLINTIEINNDSGCTVIQKTEKGSPQFYFVCVHIKTHRSHIEKLKKLLKNAKGFKERRITISNFYGEVLRKITFNSYVIGRKFLDLAKLPSHLGPFKKLKFTNDKKTKEVEKVEVNDSGVSAENEQVLKYSDIKTCEIKVNVIYAPKDVIYDDRVQCCVRYKTEKSREFMCFRDINCEAEALRFAHLFKTNCEKSIGKAGEIKNEMSHEPHVKITPIVKAIFNCQLKMSSPTELNPSPNPKDNTPTLSAAAFVTKNKTLAIKYLYMAKKMIHAINIGQPYDSIEYPDAEKTESNKNPAKFMGKFIEGDWSLTIYHLNKKIYEGKDKETLIILKDAYYIKHKEFHAVFNPKLQSFLIKYKKDNLMKILIISPNNLFLTNHSDKAPKSQFIKSISDEMGETGFLIDADEFTEKI